MSDAVFAETINGHEHWTYQCPPPPEGCGYRTFAYSPERDAVERLYASHRADHRTPPTQEPTQEVTP